MQASVALLQADVSAQRKAKEELALSHKAQAQQVSPHVSHRVSSLWQIQTAADELSARKQELEGSQAHNAQLEAARRAIELELSDLRHSTQGEVWWT
jgi:hypothetical protein